MSWLLLAAVAHADAPPPVAPASAAQPDEDLRAQLKLTLEQLARHDAELQAMRAQMAALSAKAEAAAQPKPEEHWYDRIHIRGYTQVRYNLPGAVANDKLINEQGDRSLGGNGGFIIRRARLILFGDIHPRVSIYLQPDMASVIGEQLGVAILRDWYADIFLDRKKEFRLRLGQSKVPFGFENMQSSQNRLPFDRNDPLNSTVKDERDLGLFFYWAPAHIRQRFKMLVDSGLKGSGDFGVIALGIYNGQTANKIELNKYPHAIVRATWPFAIGNQFLELSAGGYYGLVTVKTETMSDMIPVTVTRKNSQFHDGRGHVSVVLYPKPFGFIFEYNVGIGPQLGRNATHEVGNRFLYGGYLTLMYKIDKPIRTIAIIPYVRGQMYDGGKKFFTNAPYYKIREIELGVEWQIMKPFEFTLAYMISDRTSDKFPYSQQYGHYVRFQGQVNF